jgi:hypothetical protein
MAKKSLEVNQLDTHKDVEVEENQEVVQEVEVVDNTAKIREQIVQIVEKAYGDAGLEIEYEFAEGEFSLLFSKFVYKYKDTVLYTNRSYMAYTSLVGKNHFKEVKRRMDAVDNGTFSTSRSKMPTELQLQIKAWRESQKAAKKQVVEIANDTF